MDQKASLRTAFIFLTVAALLVLGTASFVANMKNQEKLTANTILFSNTNSIKVPNSHQPLPNENEGAIVLWTKPPVKIFDQFSDARDYIIFYSATNLPGLRVVYNIRTEQFEAGTPLLTTPKVDIFDDQPHQIAYTYKRGFEQALFLDGKKVDSSEFKPPRILDATGMFWAIESVKASEIAGIEIALFDRAPDSPENLG